MKRILSAALVLMFTLGVAACDNSENSGSSIISGDSENSAEIETHDVIHFEDVAPAEKGKSAECNNEIEYYTNAEVREIIGNLPNFKAADDMTSYVPKKADHVSEFYNYASDYLPPEEGLREFYALYKYLLPGYEFDESALYLHGRASDADDNFFHPYFENYDAIMNGTLIPGERAKLIIYDEGKYEKKRALSENSAYFMIRTPFGNDLCVFNKGVINREAARIYGESGYSAKEILSFGRSRMFNGEYSGYFDYVGTYSPDSGEVFPLLDKEISIKDAVDFFEDYINTLPCAITPTYRIHVNFVNVYKAEEGLYCYAYITSREYDGIPFDYTISGTHVSRGGDMGVGAMIKSGDVDWIYGCFRAMHAEEETQYTEFIPFTDAVKKASEKMTGYVNFDVTDARLVYCSGASEKVGDTFGDYRYKVYPMWRISLYNPNDGLDYTCYVNALDGGFEYYK